MMPPLFAPNQLQNSIRSIDLHGHSVQQAKKALTDIFSQAEKDHLSHVHIITGKGHHSKGNYGVLFNDIVPKFLKRPEIQSRIVGYRLDMGGYIVEFKRDVSYNQNLEKLYQFSQQFFSSLILPTHNFQKTLESAQKGNKEDQFLLYSYYSTGTGVSADTKEALVWLEKAADNGHQIAQSTLGFEYLSGKNLEKNYKKAMTWHKRAISEEEHNEPNLNSLFWIGSCQWLGTGIVRNDIEAIKNLTIAADKNHPDAAYNLGRIFTEGIKPILIDAKKGCRYLLIAAKAGIVDAQVRLAKHLFFGWGGIEINYKAALYWFSEADRLAKDPIAQYYIGRIHYEAKGVPKNVKLANEAFQKSAAQGDKDAETSIAWILITETKTPKAIELGVAKLRKLSEQRHCQSAYMLGTLFIDQREIIEKDVDQAIKYLTIAAELAEVDACYILADIYLKDKNNLNEAIRWQKEAVNLEENGETLFRLANFLHENSKMASDEILDCLTRAVDLQYAPAQEMLGDFYLEGSAVPQNTEKGIALLKEASKNGNTSAKLKLGQIFIRKDKREDQEIGVTYLAGAANAETEALFELAQCFKYGIGCTKDESKFRLFLKKAAKIKHPKALFMLGQLNLYEENPQAFEDFDLAVAAALYYTANIVVNIQDVIGLYVKQANSPHIKIAHVAEYCLAFTYFRLGSAEQNMRNIKEAIYWLKRSLKNECEHAINLILPWMEAVSSSDDGFDDFLKFLYEIANKKEKSKIRDYCCQFIIDLMKPSEEDEEDLSSSESSEMGSPPVLSEQQIQNNPSSMSEKCVMM